MKRSVNNPMPIAIGALIFLGFTASMSSLAGDSNGSMSGKTDIVDTAVSAGQFKKLAAALDAADLIPTLKGDGPYTVLAPTGEAFAKLPAGTVEFLLKPENRDLLFAIRTCHVVPGHVMANDVVNLSKATSVNGADIAIKVMDSEVLINDATVISADVGASNSVIQLLDTVILPN